MFPSTGWLTFEVCAGGGDDVGDSTDPAAGTVNDGNWHLIAGVRSGTTVQLYVDGVLRGTSTDSSGTVANVVSPFVLTAGASADTFAFGSYFNGALDDFEIYNYALAFPPTIPPVLGVPAISVISGAGTSSVVLSTSGAWTASSNASFLHISSGSASGSGNANVVFSYDAFAGTGTRSGTLTIAGLTFTVTQLGTNYIGPDGLTTVLSSGLNGPTGVAIDSSGNIYIADAGNNAVKEWNATSQQVTTLVSSGLNNPYGVAVDGSGNVYIADVGNNAVKEWNASTQQVTTLVSSGLSSPVAVAVDATGNVYIVDDGNNAIKEFNASTQQVTTLLSTGLFNPKGVAVDVAGNVYISDSNNLAIKEWNASTRTGDDAGIGRAIRKISPWTAPAASTSSLVVSG